MASLVWFVTGCSSGFGEQFVASVLARGDKIIATGRKLDQLKHLETAGAAILQLDITDSDANIRKTIETAKNIYGKIDVLVNNAGYVQIGMIEDLSNEDYLSQFNTNVFGTVKITQALLPYLRQQRSGTIVFIGSLSGWVGQAGVSAYCSSKFAVEAIAEALHEETSALGIKTLMIEPGRFRTNLLGDNRMKAITSKIPDYVEYSSTLADALSKADRQQAGDPVKLVEIIIDLVRKEGVAAGKEVPFRLPLGTDCYEDMKTKCEETLKLLAEWESVITSTDY